MANTENTSATEGTEQRTTFVQVNVPADLWKQARKAAIDEEISLSEWTTRAVRLMLATPSRVSGDTD